MRDRKETSILRDVGVGKLGTPREPSILMLPVPRVKSLWDLPALEICEIALTPYIELHILLKLAGVGFCFM